MEDFILKQNISLMNSGSYTYLHPGTGTTSAIDLSLCHPSLYLDVSWSVHQDLCGSDHYPVIIRSKVPQDRDALGSWKLHKADWNAFTDACRQEITSNSMSSVTDPILSFSEKLIAIASHTIPKSKPGKRTVNTVWFNSECKAAKRACRKALKTAKKSPSTDNMENYRIMRAKSRRTLRASRRSSWQKYVSSINSRTSIKKVWNFIGKISGKKSPSGIHHLSVNGQDITSVPDIANTLADTFSNNSSSENFTDIFNGHRHSVENKNLKFDSQNMETYNTLFKLEELVSAITKSTDSAVGPDEIHYQMLKHLPDVTLETLLQIINDCWISGSFPPSWRQAVVLPIPKADKDRTDPNSYRPIALTSCLCKVVERMINNRLVWYLEKNKIITKMQSGFRKRRSTTDQLVHLETFVREAFIQKQHAVAVFFDLEKAYDTTWKHGIMQDLFNAGLRGSLPLFIHCLLFVTHAHNIATCFAVVPRLSSNPNLFLNPLLGILSCSFMPHIHLTILISAR